MTEAEFQTNCHYLYQGDTAAPSDGDDDYTVRRGLLEAAINRWESEKGVLWRELWVMLSDAADGDKTTVADQTSYDCPSDFRFIGGFVRLVDAAGNSDYYWVIKPESAELYRNEDEPVCFVTGNKSGGYDLQFITAPTAGLTIEYPYYKEPDIPDATTDVIEMADPWFCVYFVLSKLHELDGEGDRAMKAFAEADAILRSMKTKNVMPPFVQPSAVPDRDFEIGYDGFGK